MRTANEPLMSRLGYPFMMLFRPLVRFLWIHKVHGLENIPKDGPCLVAANHESYFDFILFAAACDRKIHYLAAEKFFIHPFWKWVVRFMGCIRVDRYSNVNLKAFKEVRRVVQQGRLIGIFPEGTRSPDGQLMKAKTGVAHLAIKAGLPVIPVGMRGTFEIMSVHDSRPRIKKASIHIGKPICFNHLRDEQLDEALLTDVTDTIMLNISVLANEEYRYASLRTRYSKDT